MPYTAPINRDNPACFFFLVDQSSSMLEPFGRQPDKSKAAGVADALNHLLQNLVLKCAKSEGVRDYYHIGVIGYGSAVGPVPVPVPVPVVGGGGASVRTTTRIGVAAMQPSAPASVM